MVHAFKSLMADRGAGWFLTAAIAAAVPATALADRHDDRGRDRNFHEYGQDSNYRDDHARGRVDIDFQRDVPAPVCETAQVWVEPVYRTVTERQWVDPTYRTVYDHVWVEPVVQKQCDRVWVPDRYEMRDVVHHEKHHDVVVRERVLVERGHYADVPRDVVVPGHFEDRPRQELVCAGHWEDVTHQELVCAGHFENRPVAVVAPPRHDEGVRIDLRLPIHF